MLLRLVLLLLLLLLLRRLVTPLFTWLLLGFLQLLWLLLLCFSLRLSWLRPRALPPLDRRVVENLVGVFSILVVTLLGVDRFCASAPCL